MDISLHERHDLDGVIVVYDVMDRSSLGKAKNIVNSMAQLKMPIILVGNKCDLKQSEPEHIQPDLDDLPTHARNCHFRLSAKEVKLEPWQIHNTKTWYISEKCPELD